MNRTILASYTVCKHSVMKLIISLSLNAIRQICSSVQGLFILIGIPIPLRLPLIHSLCQGILNTQVKHNSKTERIISRQIHSWVSLSCTPHVPKGPINQNQVQLISHSPLNIFYSLLSAQQSFVSMQTYGDWTTNFSCLKSVWFQGLWTSADPRWCTGQYLL